MATRTIEIEDDEFERLEEERDELEEDNGRLREINEVLTGDLDLAVDRLEAFHIKWNDRHALLKRIGELS